MAQRYARQDELLFRSGNPVIDNLDLTLYPNRQLDWCLTTKQPLHDAQGRVVGLACLSKDLNDPGRASLIDAGFADTIDYIHAHLEDTLRVETLASMSGFVVGTIRAAHASRVSTVRRPVFAQGAH